MKQNNKGITEMFVILLSIVLIVVVIGGSYFFLGGNDRLSQDKDAPQTLEEIESGQTPITENDTLDEIQKELDETVIGSLEDDFETLESDASGL